MGLRFRIPLKSVNGLGHTFDLNPTEGKYFAVGNITLDIYIVPSPILKLTFDTLLWA